MPLFADVGMPDSVVIRKKHWWTAQVSFTMRTETDSILNLLTAPKHTATPGASRHSAHGFPSAAPLLERRQHKAGHEEKDDDGHHRPNRQKRRLKHSSGRGMANAGRAPANDGINQRDVDQDIESGEDEHQEKHSPSPA